MSAGHDMYDEYMRLLLLSDQNPYRWHAHPLAALRDSKDLLGGHVRRVRGNCTSICKASGVEPSDELLRAAIEHDLPELIMGDWPFTLTRDYRIARWAKRFIEWQIKRQMGIKWRLTRQEKLILSLADKLDAIEWAAARVSGGDFAKYFAGDFVAAQCLAAKIGASAWLGARMNEKGVPA